MFEKIKYFLEKLFNLNKFKLPQGISLDERTLLINAQKNQILNGLNLDKKSDSEILKEFKQQGLSQQQAEKKLDAIRKDIERIFDITPINEFGKNYAEYYNDGKNAIQKLLSEKQGQVAGAFYKEGLGEITLAWGDEKKGLAHIIQKHTDLDLNLIPQIVKKGNIKKTYNGFNILTDDYIVGINQGFSENNKKISDDLWIVTSFKRKDNQGATKIAYLDSITRDRLSSLNLDKPNPTTKKQISQEQKKQAHLAREAGIKKSLDLLKKKQSKSADAAVSNISSDSVKNETKPKFRKMFQKKDKDNNKDKK